MFDTSIIIVKIITYKYFIKLLLKKKKKIGAPQT